MTSHVCKQPSLIILGAGPGNPELITIKGVQALRQAEVVLYDALASPALLEFTSPHCKKVYVGKRKGKKEFSQEEIHQLIVFYTMRYGKVVRLKGGDPYVFGRGHEELEYAVRRGIHVDVIPGISSALAAPTSAGIPLTKRGVNESFWVITGTLASGEISSDLKYAAQSSATVIVLMGMTNLEQIALLFSDARSPLEPIAIIQHATLPEQRIVKATVGTIYQVVSEEKISSPAVIVIGKVVEESYLTHTWMEQVKAQVVR